MEENENENKKRNENESSPHLNSMLINIFSFSGFLSSDPLFSTIVTLYILILLYFPRIFLRLVLSPVLIITLTLLLALLRYGATQRTESRANSESNENKLETNNNVNEPEAEAEKFEKSESIHEDHNWVTCRKDTGFDLDPRFEEKFVEWNVRAPLEVIYEAYEEGGEEDENDHETSRDPNSHGKDPSRFGIERYPSLSLCYPESDSDTSSDDEFLAIGDWGSPESLCFRFYDEDRDGLIEIALDGVDNSCYNTNNNKKKRDLDFVENFHGEEENNLIEIDISPAKNA